MMQLVDHVEEALRLCHERQQVFPTLAILDSIEKQLVYVRAILRGEIKDRSRMRDVNVGVYAVREFDESDPEFAKVLKKVHYIADKMANGLKPLLQDLL